MVAEMGANSADDEEVPVTQPTAQGWSVKRLLITLGIVLGVVVGVVAVSVGLVTGKADMDKQAMAQSYQDGMRQVQETFTEHLLENYEGVTAIEWDGVEVEWRDSPVHGPSLFGNRAISHFKVYVNDKDYFTEYFVLSDRMDYDDDLERYVPNGTQTPENMDVRIDAGLYNATFDLSDHQKRAFSGFRKSQEGSPGARVVYDVHVFDFKY